MPAAQCLQNHWQHGKSGKEGGGKRRTWRGWGGNSITKKQLHLMFEQHEHFVQTRLPNTHVRGNPANIAHKTMVKRVTLQHLCSGVIFSHSSVCSITGGKNCALHKTDVVSWPLYFSRPNSMPAVNFLVTKQCYVQLQYFSSKSQLQGKKNPNNQSEPFINC